MKIARLIQGDKETYGIVSGSRVATKEDISYSTGIPVPFGIKDFMFDGWYGEVMQRSGDLAYGRDISEFELGAPIATPSKIICLAFNYRDHAREQGGDPPEDPVIVIKPRTALAGANSVITCPSFVTELDYEIELAVIVGRDCKDITEQDAAGAVFGYMILNDVSARDIQFRDGQFGRAKGFDGFAPCGPWITTADEIGDPHNLRLQTMVNGQLRQDSNTSQMFIRIPQIISRLSQSMTLERGDIISTGTPAGVALGSERFDYLRDGDKIHMEIEGLGSICNSVKFV